MGQGVESVIEDRFDGYRDRAYGIAGNFGRTLGEAVADSVGARLGSYRYADVYSVIVVEVPARSGMFVDPND